VEQTADLPFEILRLHFEGGAVEVRGTTTVCTDTLTSV
jgi:hypothetical protein